jgi:phosphonate transport system ATP-binding protein
MYRFENIRKVFNGHLVAVDDVSLKIAPGEQVAIIGPSGAGKTTLFRLLNLTLRPDGGALWLGDLDVGELRGRALRAMRRRIGTIYQQHNLVPRLPVVHNVLAGRLGAWSEWRAMWSLLRPQELDVAYAALSQVGIPEKLYARTDELSGGQQQRVAIARVLLQNPEVILADEPVASGGSESGPFHRQAASRDQPGIEQDVSHEPAQRGVGPDVFSAGDRVSGGTDPV